MISSMNQKELYKTLVGHYKPNHYTYFPEQSSSKPAEKPIKTRIPGVSVEDIESALKENAKKMKDLPVIDISNDPNMDRFEPSSLRIAESQDIGLYSDNPIKELPYKASDAIDFMCCDIQTELGIGFINGLPTKERIAEYYGAMAKRLDEAYAEGKFTKDEFDELNEMIEKQVEREATLTENKKAFYALGRNAFPVISKEEQIQQQNLPIEERMAEREKIIRDYAEKHFKINRTALMKLFNIARYGK
ncbi:MAG: DUF1707 domain-containing protein [Oscillospiraceae bacterium]|nr:DUF1707 domain-containing protein [Oscillospiraceae bacterium]